MARPPAAIEHSDELVQLTRRFFDAMIQGDADLFDEIMSDDASVIIIGTDEEEFWVGKADALAVMRAQVEESPAESYVTGVQYRFIEGWAQGPLGWVVADTESISAVGRALRLRMTAVFHLEGVRWRLVHAHGSAGQSNAELWGFEVTTRPDAIADRVREERPDLSADAAVDGTVTIVFTDIEASTEIAERLGDRAWMDLLRWHDGVVSDEADRQRGRVIKSEGDGYMVAFPSATRALDFAEGLQRRSAEGHSGEAIRVRVGVNAGDAIAERDDFFGHAVILAARVAGQARGGETMVTDSVAALVAGSPRFRFSEARTCELRGLRGEYPLRALVAVD